MISKLDVAQLVDYVKKIESLPVKQQSKLDGILSDLANYLYETGEAISELDKGLKDFDIKQKKEHHAEMEEFQKQIDLLLKLLYETEYESHYMDRALNTLSWVTRDLKKLLVGLAEE